MLRRLLGKLCEWALGYERIIYFSGQQYMPHYMEGVFLKMSNAPDIQYPGDAGYDLFTNKRIIIRSGEIEEVPTGICVEPKSRIWFEIKTRSSTFRKMGLEVQDAVIDQGYRGELFSIVFNPNSHKVLIEKWTRICQVVPHLLLPCRFIPKDRLSGSWRGKKGFGSSGG